MIRRNILDGGLLATVARRWLLSRLGITEAQSFQAREAGKGDSDYQQGLSALDARNWDQAIQSLTSPLLTKATIPMRLSIGWPTPKTAPANAKKRWAPSGNCAKPTPLAAGSTMPRRWKSRFMHKTELRSVRPPSRTKNLKLLALNSLMSSDPDKALPILRKLLASNNSDKIKERALFVLVKTRLPRPAR